MSPPQPSPFLLLHGAFRGGWAWRHVRPLLTSAGHDVYAPSLPGAGERVGELGRVLSLDVWVDEMVRLVEAEDLTDLVLVGHSQAGIVTTGLAARLPERIRALVHLDAGVPKPGERAIDLGPGGGGGTEPPRSLQVPPRPLVAGVDMDSITAAWVNDRLTPTPVGPSLDPVAAVPDSVPQHFFFCAGTPEEYPSTVTRARLEQQGAPFAVLDCGHDAPLTAPELVAGLLLEVVGSG